MITDDGRYNTEIKADWSIKIKSPHLVTDKEKNNRVLHEAHLLVWYWMLDNLTNEKTGNNVTAFEKMFGVSNDTAHKQCINCLFIYLKFYIYHCRFKKLQQDFDAFMVFIN